MGMFITKFSGPDGESLTFTPTEIIFRPGSILSAPPEIHPLASVRGVQLEAGEDLQERVTATRIVALGFFALAVKKKSGGDKWLAIEGDEYAWMIRVDRKHVNDAMRFVAKLRPAAAKAKVEEAAEARITDEERASKLDELAETPWWKQKSFGDMLKARKRHKERGN